VSKNIVLFIGNFLSRSSGSLSVSEFIANQLEEELGIRVVKISHAVNRFVRLIEIYFAVQFNKYSIVHIDVFSGNSFLFARMAAAIGKMRNKKVILSLHGGALHEHYSGREKSFTSLFKNSYIQSPSTFLKGFFESKGFSIAYCPNPIDLNKFPFFQKPDTSTSKKLLWVRAFSDIYNPHLAIRVLQNVLMQFPDTMLTMIGPDKGLMNKTLALAEKLNLKDRVDIIGSVPNNELYKYFHSHDVYLNTTSYESFGVAVVEATSCGIPVVSFSVGEIPYLWTNNDNILLAKFGDVENVGDQVRRLFLDRDLSNRISMNARKKAEEFSWDNVKEHWFNIVEH